jgi:2-polyprenyl-3-methyl-5-hydroxy-6-metoxy-1,4-benzoquinol methylase
MNNILKWFPENDLYTKTKELEIHALLHDKNSKDERNAEQILAGKRKIRAEALEKALTTFNRKINGKVLEIGAGDGWCSAYLAKNKIFEELYVMECNLPAVEQLIPKTFEILSAPTDRINLVHGSFNYINKDINFNVIVAMGALHHAKNLFHTFKECYEALRPGGFLIAQEPYMLDSTKNEFYFEREKKEIEFWGVKTLKNSERSDVFYRECEYRTAAYHVGFDFNCIYLDESQQIKKSLFQKLLGRNNEIKEFPTDRPRNMIFLLSKPKGNSNVRPVTSWEQ